MPKKNRKEIEHEVESLIFMIRGERVILDSDLARVYGESTARLNQQVRRNADRFPTDFVFELRKEEFARLMLQTATSKKGRGGRRKLPLVFTEHGAIMAANVLNSRRAVQMSVFVVRAFVRMRSLFRNNKALAFKLSELEREVKKRLDVHETAIVGILQRILALIDPPALPEPKKKPIGFAAAEE